MIPSLRWQGKLNFSETVDDINTDSDARFAVRRGGFGFAFCLLKNSHLNILGRVNLTYELPPLSQSTAQNIAVDERSLVASVEMAYPVSRLWEAGSGKLAFKEAQIRNARDAGV